MEARPFSSKEDAILDIKPLRSLAPMFPAPFGVNTTFNSSSPVPFVCVSPFGSPSGGGFPPGFPSSFAPPDVFAQAANNGGSAANGSYSGAFRTPVFQTPRSASINLDEDPDSTVRTSTSGRKVGRPRRLPVDGSETDGSERKRIQTRKKPQKITDLSIIHPLSLDPREAVEGVMMTFDALRRRLLQLDEVTDASKRPALKAGALMMANDLRANVGKRIGPVPGVEIGDIFYFRIEMCVVGMHGPSMAGIDYITTKNGDVDEPAAISVVSAGGYENEDGDVDFLIYTGQGGGGTSKYFDKKQSDDQKLERGNLALEKSFQRGNVVRVVRSTKDLNSLTGRIYIYDGLYKIQESWMDKGKSGFNVFKYKLFREPGQAEGIAVWKHTEEWRTNPASRNSVILPDISSGIENLPVCLVNEVDNAKGPSHFTYTTRMKYLKPISSMRPFQGCGCLSVCLPGDISCSCAQQNGSSLPYNSSGLLVSRKAILYECSSSCACSVNCRNRVTQKGIKIHFEVFKTRDRGWGLRSWDPIRAGTFICEYLGEVVDKIEVDYDGEEDQYVFRATYVDEKTLKWNYGPVLLGEPSISHNEIFKPLPIIISSKNMGNVARFMNHSCSPNVFWQPILYDHSEEGYPHVMFFALKHIPPMTELTFDYGLSGGNGFDIFAGNQPKKCLCGSPNCREFFG